MDFESRSACAANCKRISTDASLELTGSSCFF